MQLNNNNKNTNEKRYQCREQARLKYRIESRKVTFWLETINLAGITRDALLLIAKEIGSPEKPEGKEGKAGTGIVPLLGNLQ